MRVVIALLLCVAAAQVAAETKYYQCKDAKGHPVYSDKPCGADAIAGSVEAPPASGSVDSVDFSAISASNTVREADRQVEYLEDRVERYKNERDRKLADLERRSSYASNNLAGAQYQESLATERQAVTAQYQSKIDADNGKVERLRNNIDAVHDASSP